MQINPKIIQLLSNFLLTNIYSRTQFIFAKFEAISCFWDLVEVALEGLEKFFKNGNDKKRSRMVHDEVVCKSIQGKF